MVQSLKALIPFAKNPDLVSSTNLATNNSFFWLLQVLHPHGSQTFIQASIYIHKIQVNLLQKYQKLFFLFPSNTHVVIGYVDKARPVPCSPPLLLYSPISTQILTSILPVLPSFYLLNYIFYISLKLSEAYGMHNIFLITIPVSCTQVLYSHPKLKRSFG